MVQQQMMLQQQHEQQPPHQQLRQQQQYQQQNVCLNVYALYFALFSRHAKYCKIPQEINQCMPDIANYVPN